MSVDGALPLVSVVVPVRNGEATIRDCVAALAESDYPAERHEIVVVDNASTDRTADLLRTLPVRCAYEPRVGRSHARNRGIAESRGSIVAFTDADCAADRRWLSEIVEGFRSERIWGLAGEILAHAPRTAAQRFMAQRDHHLQRHVMQLPERFAITSNVAFRRETFDRVGLFDPRFVTAEDVDFGWRFFDAGLEMSYRAQATVSHRLRATGWELFRQQEAGGYGRVLLRERYGLPRGYGLGTWGELGAAIGGLGRRAVARSRGDELAFPLYDVVVRLALRAGALRRELTRPLVGAVS
jgi:glycosyltransferase involved in cell wall biosynthesis